MNAHLHRFRTSFRIPEIAIGFMNSSAKNYQFK